MMAVKSTLPNADAGIIVAAQPQWLLPGKEEELRRRVEALRRACGPNLRVDAMVQDHPVLLDLVAGPYYTTPLS